MDTVLIMHDDHVSLTGFDLNDEISFHFLPSGVTINNHFSPSMFSLNVYLKDGICDNRVLLTLLRLRGYAENTPYDYELYDDVYYEQTRHKMNEII